jgi:hypothetical protein
MCIIVYYIYIYNICTCIYARSCANTGKDCFLLLLYVPCIKDIIDTCNIICPEKSSQTHFKHREIFSHRKSIGRRKLFYHRKMIKMRNILASYKGHDFYVSWLPCPLSIMAAVPYPSWLPCPPIHHGCRTPYPTWLPCPYPSWLPCLYPSWLPCPYPSWFCFFWLEA